VLSIPDVNEIADAALDKVVVDNFFKFPPKDDVVSKPFAL
jgi:predicted TIM-barrel enzyme